MKAMHALLLAPLSLPAVALATPAAPAAPPKAEKSQKADKARPAERPAVLDWSQVDRDSDHFVSPEEMATYLRNNPGPLARPSRATSS